MAQPTSIDILKELFEDGKTPNGEDFGRVFDSYVHRSTRLPQEQVLGLNDALRDRPTREEVHQEIQSTEFGMIEGVVRDALGDSTTDAISQNTVTAEVERIDSDYEKLQGELLGPIKQYGVGILINSGSFMRPDGTTGSNANYSSSDYLELSSEVIRLRIKAYISGVSVSPVVFFDSNRTFISGITVGAAGYIDKIYTIPTGVRYYKVTNNNTYVDFLVQELGYSVMTAAETDQKINDATSIRQENFKTASIFVNVGFLRPDGTTGTSASYRYSDYIDIAGVSKLYIHTQVSGVSVSPAVFFDSNKNFISGITASILTETDMVISVPSGARYMITSILATAQNIFNMGVDIMLRYMNFNSVGSMVGTAFISPDGSDTNDGLSEGRPVKTLTRMSEILDPAGELILLAGDYIGYNLNLSAYSKMTGIGKARILGGERFLTATKTNGYNRIYQVNRAATIPVEHFLWQHDIEDDATVILTTERSPYHRGRRTRLGSTRLYHATSIQEIEDTTERLMWYQAGGILYFSKTDGSDLAINPVIYPTPTSRLVAAGLRNVDIQSLEILYNSILTTKLTGRMINMLVGFSNDSGSIRYDNTVGMLFKNCEAFACYNDALNGHTSGAYKRTHVIFEDCYSHDNADDDESCHEFCDVIHRGGLYEYSGNGITPASGGHASCYNSYVRRHGDFLWTRDKAGTGFSAQGASTDDGIGTNILAFGCLSENNIRGYRGLADLSSLAVNSISKNDRYPFADIQQINCATL